MAFGDNGGARNTEEKSPWAQPGFIAASAVVAILVLLGIVLAITAGSSKSPRDRTQKPASGPSRPTAPAAAQSPDASVCGLPAGDQATPTQAPASKWELVDGFAAPTASSTLGPGKVTDGLRSCFAHSPSGALYAAVNAIAMTASSNHREAFVRHLTVPGVGRDRGLRDLGPDTGSASSVGLQVAGFAISDYQPSSAVVDLALRSDNGAAVTYVHVALAMRWRTGDWKLAPPDTGQPFEGMARVDSLSGYVPWKAS